MNFSEKSKGVSNVVIVGMWNYGIFTPDWVKENVLSNEPTFNVLYPTAPLLSMKFVVPEKYSFGINGNRLEFQLLSNSNESSRDLIHAISNILTRLTYTPVNSLGINYVYSSDESVDHITKLDDTPRLNSLLGKNLMNIELIRSYQLDCNLRLNYKIYQVDNKSNFDFNYSFEIKNCSDILNILDNDDVLNNYRAKSLKLLDDLYNNGLE